MQDEFLNRSSRLDELPLQRAWIEIDLDAIAHNVQQLCQHLDPQTDLMAVVKADGYGHGAVAVAETAIAAGATWLGVATVTEGIELRRAGIRVPILLMGATHSAREVEAIAFWKIQPTISSFEQANRFSAALAASPDALGPLPVHLILDTGMSRLGVCHREAVAFVNHVRQLPHLAIASVYSHLATADDPDPSTMRRQHQRYEAAIAQIRQSGFCPPRLHLANSAAALIGRVENRSLQYNMVRVGLALYGLYPAPHLASTLSLKPVLQVNARITQVRRLEAGSGVSYGHRFVSDRPLKVAVAGIGYADGIPRNLSNRLEGLIQGRRVRQLGAITMDQIMLDVSEIEDVAAGDRVVLLGHSGDETITADDWAEMLGTISWEILCGFKHRLPRIARLSTPISDSICFAQQSEQVSEQQESEQVEKP